MQPHAMALEPGSKLGTYEILSPLHRGGDHNDSGTGVRLADGFEHQLLDRLISEASQIPQKLPLAHEVGA